MGNRNGYTDNRNLYTPRQEPREIDLPGVGISTSTGSAKQGASLELQGQAQLNAQVAATLELAARQQDTATALGQHLAGLRELAERIQPARRTYMLSGGAGQIIERELMPPATGSCMIESLVFFTSATAGGSTLCTIVGLNIDIGVLVIAGSVVEIPVKMLVSFPQMVRFQPTGTGTGFWHCLIQLVRYRE